MELSLCVPTPLLETTYLAGLNEMENDSEQSAWIYLGDSTSRDFPKQNFKQYVETLLEREHNPPKGFVTNTVYWAVSAGEMVGRISIRHELNDFLKKVGGHIGYIVRPSYRRKGIATEMLREVLQTPRAQSIGRLLLTCDEDNIASEKSIVKNGGVFDSVVDLGSTGPKKKAFFGLRSNSSL